MPPCRNRVIHLRATSRNITRIHADDRERTFRRTTTTTQRFPRVPFLPSHFFAEEKIAQGNERVWYILAHTRSVAPYFSLFRSQFRSSCIPWSRALKHPRGFRWAELDTSNRIESNVSIIERFLSSVRLGARVQCVIYVWKMEQARKRIQGEAEESSS